MLVARSIDKLQRISQKCLTLGAKSATFISADLSSVEESSFKNIIDSAVNLLGGGLDVLVINHVGTGVSSQIAWQSRFNLTELLKEYHNHVFSYMALAHYAVPFLQKNEGRLMVSSSVAGMLPIPTAPGYTSEKHALHGYFNSLRLNMRMHGHAYPSITICILGAIATESFNDDARQTKFRIEAESPQECARAMIVASETRQPTLFFPFSKVFTGFALSRVLPAVLDEIIYAAVPKTE